MVYVSMIEINQTLFINKYVYKFRVLINKYMVEKKQITTGLSWSILVSRLTIAALFAVSVFGKITDFSGQVSWVSSMYPLATFLIVGAILLELAGVISLVLGYEVKWGAGILIFYTLLASLMFHIGDGQLMAFLKNFAIIGGLIALINVPTSGKLALDKK